MKNGTTIHSELRTDQNRKFAVPGLNLLQDSSSSHSHTPNHPSPK
jgi:hypothetical protein